MISFRVLALIERHADPLFLAPDDVARLFEIFARHEQREAVGDEQRRHDFERGSGVGHVADGAVDPAAAELDRSGLQLAVARGDALLVHAGHYTPSRDAWEWPEAVTRVLCS